MDPMTVARRLKALLLTGGLLALMLVISARSSSAVAGRLSRLGTVVQSPCYGDCDNDGSVTVDELILGVNLALGVPADSCARLDASRDSTVSVDEIIQAVNALLVGCSGGFCGDGYYDTGEECEPYNFCLACYCEGEFGNFIRDIGCLDDCTCPIPNFPECSCFR